jgi:hypothetical protein
MYSKLSVKNFTEYTSQDFATEPLFIKWVQQPDDAEINNFWYVWTNKNPNKQNDIAEAKVIVRHITSQYTDLETIETKNLWRRIQNSVSHLPEIDELDQNLKPIASTIYLTRWVVAFCMGIGFILWVLFQLSRI